MTAYRMLSDDFISKHRAFMAANSKTMLSPDSRGAHDAVTPELRRQLARMTPAQKREIKLAMDAGEDPNGDLNEKKFAAKLLESLGDGRDDSGFGEKLIRLLDQCFPGCCGDLTGEDEEVGETDYSPEEDMAGDDDDEEKKERLDFKSAGATRKLTPEQMERRRKMVEGERQPEEADDDDYSISGQFRRAHAANDQPPKFPGSPRVGGKLVGMDEASDYARRFPETRRIALDDNFGKKELQVPRSLLNKLAFDARVAKRVNQELDDVVDDYEARFPETARIGLR
jgi:hypothetical protein